MLRVRVRVNISYDHGFRGRAQGFYILCRLQAELLISNRQLPGPYADNFCSFFFALRILLRSRGY